MSELSERDTTPYDIPLADDNPIDDPHSMIIKFPSGHTTDIGALCYLERDSSNFFENFKNRRGRHSGRKVNLKTFDNNRVSIIRKLIRHISDEMRYSGKRPETIRDMTNRFIPFMDWSDNNNFTDSLHDYERSKFIFSEYVSFLRERVNMNMISVNSAARQQFTVLAMLEGLFNTDTFAHGINLLKTNVNSKIPTSPANEQSQSKMIRLCDALFSRIVPFVTKFQKYPLKIKMPEFAGYPDDNLWAFPTTTWFKHPNETKKTFHAYNYRYGRLSTLSEIKSISEHSKKPDAQLKNSIRNAKHQIEAANTDQYNIHRLHQGINALNFFIVLFLSETVINWSQLVNLTWCNEYEIDSTRQRFQSIKWRANNKIVHFEIPTTFMPKFKQFLLLREYLLEGHECKWLFFQRGPKRNGEPTQIKASLNHTHVILKNIYPELKPVTAREWRATKSDWLIRNTDPATTAMVLQNTEKTVLASYIAGSETTQIQEISGYLNAISKTVIAAKARTKSNKPNSLGICSDYGNPSTLEISTASLPNCQNPEGCLFCDKYKAHADEVDVRKLISCKYCITQATMSNAQSSTAHMEVVNPILKRIDEILVEISKHNSTIVDQIKLEVEELGELDHYWGQKMEMLLELGLMK